MNVSHKFSGVILFLLAFVFCVDGYSQSQTFLRGSYVRSPVTYDGSKFVVYNFSRRKTARGTIKAKYFAKNANDQFAKWKNGKNILFYCAGAFSETWEPGSPPLGICVDNGTIVNRNIENSMDGLVIVYNGGAQQGGIAVINIDKETVKVDGGKKAYNLRNSSHKVEFLNWAASKSATVFQTQLMYTRSLGYGFPAHRLTYGNRAERRFLAICTRGKSVFHIVIDHPQSDYLNHAAQQVVKYLSDNLKYEVFGLFNLDTGGKNIMKAYDEMGRELANGPIDVKEATNLLVYYVD